MSLNDLGKKKSNVLILQVVFCLVSGRCFLWDLVVMHFYMGAINLQGMHDEVALPRVKLEGWSELTIRFLLVSYSPTQRVDL